jgi:hypothetical protein
MDKDQSKLMSLVEQKQSLLNNYLKLKEELDEKGIVFNNVRSLLYRIEGMIEYLEEKGARLPD